MPAPPICSDSRVEPACLVVARGRMNKNTSLLDDPSDACLSEFLEFWPDDTSLLSMNQLLGGAGVPEPLQPQAQQQQQQQQQQYQQPPQQSGASTAGAYFGADFSLEGQAGGYPGALHAAGMPSEPPLPGSLPIVPLQGQPQGLPYQDPLQHMGLQPGMMGGLPQFYNAAPQRPDPGALLEGHCYQGSPFARLHAPYYSTTRLLHALAILWLTLCVQVKVCPVVLCYRGQQAAPAVEPRAAQPLRPGGLGCQQRWG